MLRLLVAYDVRSRWTNAPTAMIFLKIFLKYFFEKNVMKKKLVAVSCLSLSLEGGGYTYGPTIAYHQLPSS